MTKIATFVGAAVLAIWAPLAQATIQIQYQIDGVGPLITCATGTDAIGASTGILCGGIAGPPTTTGLEASSNWPGTSSLSEVLGAVLSISNTSTATHKIEIFITAQDFTAPVTPPNIILDSHVGGTVAVGSAADLLSFKSCVDPTNSLTACAAGSIQSGLGTPAITAAGSFKDDQFGVITSLASPYSISQELTVTLGAGANVNLSTSTTLTPVPEPMSIVLLGGVVLVSSRLVRRRRRGQASQV